MLGLAALGLEGLEGADGFPAAGFELLGLEDGAFAGLGIRGAELSAAGLLSDGLGAGALAGAGLLSAGFSACGGLAGGSAAVNRGVATPITVNATNAFTTLASFMI
ncbi:MAG TPA: hypothetical protein VL175_05590 [Pirellulales bacterium]|nr:hypothetical protein [Pirellulales bacterium]